MYAAAIVRSATTIEPRAGARSFREVMTPSSASLATRPLLPDVLVDVPSFGTCRPVDFWDAWRYAQADVNVAFRAWITASSSEQGDRHAAYRAALDREEQAAAMLASALALVSHQS